MISPSKNVSIWDRLLEPAATIREPERRRRARLLSALLATQFLLSSLSTVLVLFTVFQPSDLYLAAGATLILAVAYSLSRTRHYNLAALLAISTLSGAVFAGELLNPDSSTLYFLVLGVLVSSLFLSRRATALIMAATILGIGLLSVFVPALATRDVIGAIFAVLCVGVVGIVAITIRQQDLQQIQDQARRLVEDGVRQEQAEVIERSEKRFRALIENSSDAITLLDADGTATYDSPAAPGMLGYHPDQWIGKNVLELVHADDSQRIQAMFQNLGKRPGARINSILRLRHENGSWLWIEAVATNLLAEPSVKAIVVNYHDITERITLHQQTGQRLQHLAALSEIDQSIMSSFDLRTILETLLNHVIAELNIDAADVLLFDSNSLMLERIAKRGFRGSSIMYEQPRLDKGYAGQAILERRKVKIENIKEQHDDEFLGIIAAQEDFVSYYAVPLMAKGYIKGVLEIFNRSPLEPDAEWLDFLDTLAGQAAIAIDNVTLFDSLQRSNAELSQAYDATIEGWSHALDLRDRETEGHTQRVTEITIRLARTFGLGDAELAQVRWGTLLHDIGKMGVPDAILLKPGPLTEEEWVIMRKHPTLAHKMLAPIQYLHSALDIPYCHHEKWDGTGYPRGLKGEEIPLTARIFAVVDVWDALRSNRPYRAAWSKEKVRKHIKSLAGTHFDPQVVKLFLESDILASRKRK